ncbi:MAG TPA: hypothetical protein VHD81_08395 [Mycobacteriales bacterium]|nr:hypothetical protein [Mycobacteriales bacterium]
MTDTSILPTAADAGPALPGAPAPLLDDEPGDDRRRLMVIAGVIVGVLILVVAYFLLKGGGSSDDATGVVPRGTPNAAAPPAPPVQGGSAKAGSNSGSGNKVGTKLPKTSDRRLARDPFKPLLVDNTAAGGTDTSGSGTADGGAVPPAANVTPPGTPVSVRFVKVTSDSGGSAVAEFAVTYSRPHSVAIFDVAAPTAGSTEGTTFANVFALLGIQGGVVTLQVGDDTPFDLKKGASHIV